MSIILTSPVFPGFGVLVAVGVLVEVPVLVGVLVAVPVLVAVLVGVLVPVLVALLVAVGVGVLVDGSGLESGGNVEIAVDDLAGKTGFAATMEGTNGAASYGQLVTLGILQGADPMAQEVVKFFMTGQHYQDVLALAPFGKVPVLESAVEGWSGLSDYFQYYSSDTLAQIANGYETMQRWLFRPDYDATQRAVIGDIEGRLLISQVISNIALEGTMTPETAAEWLQEQVEILYTERLGE